MAEEPSAIEESSDLNDIVDANSESEDENVEDVEDAKNILGAKCNELQSSPAHFRILPKT